MLNIQSESGFFLKVPGAVIVLLRPVGFCRRGVFLRWLFKSDKLQVARSVTCYPLPFKVLFDVLINGVF